MISLFTGAMGCGKSAHIINHYEQYDVHDMFLAFKPKVDSRTPNRISSRDGRYIDAIEITSFQEILDICKSKNIDIIYIDEVQFIDISGLKELFVYVQNNDISIVAGGLDLTSELDPFQITGVFMCYANRIVKLKSECNICGVYNATLSDCLIEKNGAILVGNDEAYIKTCNKCHSKIK